MVKIRNKMRISTVNFKCPEEIHRQFKIYCHKLSLKEDKIITMREILTEFMYSKVKDKVKSNEKH